MKNIKNIALCLLMLLTGVAKAQQDAMFSQYMFNPIAVNPAYVGSNEVLTFTGLFRKQWVGIEGAPTTGTFSVDAPLRQNTMGLGLNIVADKVGISNTIGVFASYAYRIKLSEKSRLAMGLQAGFSQYVADFASVQTNDPDQAFLSAGTLSLLQPNVGVGLWYNDEKLFIGASAPHLINNELDDEYKFLNDTDGARQYRHYFVTAGYVFDLNEDWALKPSLLFKAVQGAPLQMDINATFWYLDRFGAGLSWRSMSSANVLLGYKINDQLSAGYAYDFSTTDLRKYNSGSHELMLRYHLKSNKTRIITPRFF
ncbi:MAG: type IX secretion system membrane protein PorP/SprF [Thermonemataceae bacterium]|nr:type IX secretion system membrane protein PorP/SprF [Thermonemataceae bacterium]